MSHLCHHFWTCYKTLTFCLLLTRCTIPCACHAKRHLNAKKWSENVVFLTCLLRNVLPATMACTFSTSPTSKSALKPVIFYTFDFDMCFAPQRHALFRQRNFYKCSKAAVALYILTSTCASRHNGVRFFDSATSKSGPNLVCFVPFDFDMCFAPQQRALFATSKSAPELRCFVHFDFEMRFAPQRRALFHLSSGQLAPHPPL